MKVMVQSGVLGLGKIYIGHALCAYGCQPCKDL